MSRSGYSEDCDGWDLIRWRGAVNSAIKGKRGQALLTEMAQALDALPQKRLIDGELISKEGEVCALGAVAKCRGLDVSNLNPNDSGPVAEIFNIAEALAKEIVFENDDEGGWRHNTPEQRWQRMRKWVEQNLLTGPHTPKP